MIVTVRKPRGLSGVGGALRTLRSLVLQHDPRIERHGFSHRLLAPLRARKQRRGRGRCARVGLNSDQARFGVRAIEGDFERAGVLCGGVRQKEGVRGDVGRGVGEGVVAVGVARFVLYHVGGGVRCCLQRTCSNATPIFAEGEKQANCNRRATWKESRQQQKLGGERVRNQANIR